ncbi:MAG TPA: diaminopimelate decarboxylase [Pyrinomonadaceae bacterium]|nr:diaminopimelate decarboxylase [Pyrinomonadaceae bacterium]
MSKAWEIENFLSEKDNQLFINGVSAVELAKEYGTPLFVFSEARIKHNIARLQKAENFIDCQLKVCYAAKANSNMAILRTVKESNCDLEVNSGGELWKALKVGFKGEQLIFNGTSKEIWEIEDAIKSEVYAIQVDSLYELSLIEETAKRLNKRANVSLRLVPEIETNTHSGLQTALLTSKFGMMPDEALSAFHTYKYSEFLNLCGVHLHIGSQNPAAEPYSEALKTLFESLEKIYEETGLKLAHLNLGGGFPVNYLRDRSQAEDFSEAEREMFSADFEPADAIKAAWQIVKDAAIASNAENLLENITLLLEPGRSVIADAGICLTTVRNRKERPVQLSENITDHRPLTTDHWLLTDAGFNILLSMETYKWYYHLISAERASEEHNFPYKLAGPLCDGGDVYFDIEGAGRLPDHRLLPENIQPDEVLALLNCGAYSIAQMFQYNGRFLPCVVLVKDGGEVELIRKRDTFEDLINNDIW